MSTWWRHSVGAAIAVAGVAALVAVGSSCNTGRTPPGGGKCPSGCTKCDPKGGCLDCAPGKNVCGDSATVLACNANGTLGSAVKACDAVLGESCVGGECQGACATAAAARSYIGCDYWPVTTINSLLNPEFDFAVAVANPKTIGDVIEGPPAQVTVELGGQVVATRTVKAGTVEVITLPWVEALSQNRQAGSSALVPDGAYHLTSTVPVTVYQFNPLQFEKPSTPECMDPGSFGDPNCHSFTNDASILLPTPVLRGEYIVLARGTFGLRASGQNSSLPGFFAVVATEDNTTVTVTYSAHTEGAQNVPSRAPGAEDTYLLDKGTVLQVLSKKATTPCAATSTDPYGTYCDLGPSYDLTGTRIIADKPVAVFGGHTCSFVPYNKWACDHLEEQLFPLDTWGQGVIAVQTEPQAQGEPNLFRIVSGSDGNEIEFDPPVRAPVTLDAGKFVEFTATGGFRASGKGRIAVVQYMVGQNYTSDFDVEVGDPSMGLAVPVEQYRKSYDFLTPSTYTRSYVTIIAPVGALVDLDGDVKTLKPVSIGNTGFGYTRVEVPAGAHHISSDEEFGIMVSGVGNFTSYLYPGGLNLKEIPVQ